MLLLRQRAELDALHRTAQALGGGGGGAAAASAAPARRGEGDMPPPYAHSRELKGRIQKLFEERQYGFIRLIESGNEEYFFHFDQWLESTTPAKGLTVSVTDHIVMPST